MGDRERRPSLKGHLRKGALSAIIILVAIINVAGIFFLEIAWIGVLVSVFMLYIIIKAMYLAWFKS